MLRDEVFLFIQRLCAATGMNNLMQGLDRCGILTRRQDTVHAISCVPLLIQPASLLHCAWSKAAQVTLKAYEREKSVTDARDIDLHSMHNGLHQTSASLPTRSFHEKAFING